MKIIGFISIFDYTISVNMQHLYTLILVMTHTLIVLANLFSKFFLFFIFSDKFTNGNWNPFPCLVIPAQHGPNLLGPVNITVNRIIQCAIRHLVAFFQIDAHHVISPSMGDSISVSLWYLYS